MRRFLFPMAALLTLGSLSCGGSKDNTTPTPTAPTPAPTPVLTTIRVTLVDSVLVVGKTTQATAATLDQFGAAMPGKVVTWRSTDSTIASVQQTGIVLALKDGAVSIQATADTKQGSANLRALSVFTADRILKILRTDSPVYGFMSRYQLGDLNGDGLADVLWGGWFTDSQRCAAVGSCAGAQPANPKVPLVAILQNSSGEWTDASAQLFGGDLSASWNRAHIGDFNRDGKPDVFFSAFYDIPVVKRPSSYFLGAGNSVGILRSDIGGDVWAHGSAKFDFNGDGCEDILMADMKLYSGTCTGTFSEQRLPWIQNSCAGTCTIVPIQNVPGVSVYLQLGGIDVCVGDLDGDSKPELLITDAQPALSGPGWVPQPQYDLVAVKVDWSAMPWRPIAAYALPTPLFDKGNSTTAPRSHDMHCIISDLNNDGRKDVLINSTYNPPAGESWAEKNHLQVYLNKGAFLFDDISPRAFPGKTTEGSPTNSFVLQDLNDDGNDDLFIASAAFTSANPNYVWLGNGDGTFRPFNGVEFTTLIASARTTIAKAGLLPANIPASGLFSLGIIPLRRKNGSYDFIVPMELKGYVGCQCVSTLYLTLAAPGFRFR